MDADKRDDERLAILGELQGAATIAQPLAVKELSRGGAQVEASFPLLLDSIHEFRLQLGARAVVVKGRVAHCQVVDVNGDHIVYRAGIQFVDAPDWVADAVGRFLDDIRTGRRG